MMLYKIDPVSRIPTEEKHSDLCIVVSGESITYRGKACDRKCCFL